MGLVVLLVFVHYCYQNEIAVNLLESHTTGQAVFNAVDTCMIKNNISWQKCVDVCTDRAQAMLGKTTGVVACIKALVPSCSSSHCVIH
jgi:hypothetical protein